jgi:hypothetical protein
MNGLRKCGIYKLRSIIQPVVIMLSKTSQTEEDKYCTFSLIGEIQSLNMDDRSIKQVLCGGGHQWKKERTG